MDIEVIVYAYVNGWDNVGLIFYGEPNVTIECFVEYVIDGLF